MSIIDYARNIQIPTLRVRGTKRCNQHPHQFDRARSVRTQMLGFTSDELTEEPQAGMVRR
ncbi:MAG: hypothetical protein V4618_10855 [Pseudomonadota bacterium]